jgi:hypothetical protein
VISSSRAASSSKRTRSTFAISISEPRGLADRDTVIDEDRVSDEQADHDIRPPSALRQFGIAVFFGLLAATITYKFTASLAIPDEAVGNAQAYGAYKFVYFMTALAGGLAYLIATRVYLAVAARQFRKTLDPAEARVVKDKPAP